MPLISERLSDLYPQRLLDELWFLFLFVARNTEVRNLS